MCVVSRGISLVVKDSGIFSRVSPDKLSLFFNVDGHYRAMSSKDSFTFFRHLKMVEIGNHYTSLFYEEKPNGIIKQVYQGGFTRSSVGADSRVHIAIPMNEKCTGLLLDPNSPLVQYLRLPSFKMKVKYFDDDVAKEADLVVESVEVRASSPAALEHVNNNMSLAPQQTSDLLKHTVPTVLKQSAVSLPVTSASIVVPVQAKQPTPEHHRLTLQVNRCNKAMEVLSKVHVGKSGVVVTAVFDSKAVDDLHKSESSDLPKGAPSTMDVMD